ncbi:putative uncharacterized protein DDB_G0282133 [Chrysoperla carnea]|uniref:putative uncharacterized protein DDB_G0282133 n=1 Tax=Chrysoperla carnea TaxID=189513 RepID=UPI001D099A99|nr:putative uncharacterized protein DDB_G0282133 [Chrysoperla carnea]
MYHFGGSNSHQIINSNNIHYGNDNRTPSSGTHQELQSPYMYSNHQIHQRNIPETQKENLQNAALESHQFMATTSATNRGNGNSSTALLRQWRRRSTTNQMKQQLSPTQQIQQSSPPLQHHNTNQIIQQSTVASHQINNNVQQQSQQYPVSTPSHITGHTEPTPQQMRQHYPTTNDILETQHHSHATKYYPSLPTNTTSPTTPTQPNLDQIMDVNYYNRNEPSAYYGAKNQNQPKPKYPQNYPTYSPQMGYNKPTAVMNPPPPPSVQTITQQISYQNHVAKGSLYRNYDQTNAELMRNRSFVNETTSSFPYDPYSRGQQKLVSNDYYHQMGYKLPPPNNVYKKSSYIPSPYHPAPSEDYYKYQVNPEHTDMSANNYNNPSLGTAYDPNWLQCCSEMKSTPRYPCYPEPMIRKCNMNTYTPSGPPTASYQQRLRYDEYNNFNYNSNVVKPQPVTPNKYPTWDQNKNYCTTIADKYPFHGYGTNSLPSSGTNYYNTENYLQPEKQVRYHQNILDPYNNYSNKQHFMYPNWRMNTQATNGSEIIDFENHIKVNRTQKYEYANKSKLNLKEFLETWDEDEEAEENQNNHTIINLPDVVLSNKASKEDENMLYILESTNIPEETVWSDYKHIQQIDKLPDNIKLVEEIKTPNELTSDKLQHEFDAIIPDSTRCDTVIKSPDTTADCIQTTIEDTLSILENDGDIVSSTCSVIKSPTGIASSEKPEKSVIEIKILDNSIVENVTTTYNSKATIIDFETKDITVKCNGHCSFINKCEQCQTDDIINELISPRISEICTQSNLSHYSSSKCGDEDEDDIEEDQDENSFNSISENEILDLRRADDEKRFNFENLITKLHTDNSPKSLTAICTEKYISEQFNVTTIAIKHDDTVELKMVDNEVSELNENGVLDLSERRNSQLSESIITDVKEFPHIKRHLSADDRIFDEHEVKSPKSPKIETQTTNASTQNDSKTDNHLKSQIVELNDQIKFVPLDSSTESSESKIQNSSSELNPKLVQNDWGRIKMKSESEQSNTSETNNTHQNIDGNQSIDENKVEKDLNDKVSETINYCEDNSLSVNSETSSNCLSDNDNNYINNDKVTEDNVISRDVDSISVQQSDNFPSTSSPKFEENRHDNKRNLSPLNPQIVSNVCKKQELNPINDGLSKSSSEIEYEDNINEMDVNDNTVPKRSSLEEQQVEKINNAQDSESSPRDENKGGDIEPSVSEYEDSEDSKSIDTISENTSNETSSDIDSYVQSPIHVENSVVAKIKTPMNIERNEKTVIKTPLSSPESISETVKSHSESMASVISNCDENSETAISNTIEESDIGNTKHQNFFVNETNSEPGEEIENEKQQVINEENIFEKQQVDDISLSRQRVHEIANEKQNLDDTTDGNIFTEKQSEKKIDIENEHIDDIAIGTQPDNEKDKNFYDMADMTLDNDIDNQVQHAENMAVRTQHKNDGKEFVDDYTILARNDIDIEEQHVDCISEKIQHAKEVIEKEHSDNIFAEKQQSKNEIETQNISVETKHFNKMDWDEHVDNIVVHQDDENATGKEHVDDNIINQELQEHNEEEKSCVHKVAQSSEHTDEISNENPQIGSITVETQPENDTNLEKQCENIADESEHNDHIFVKTQQDDGLEKRHVNNIFDEKPTADDINSEKQFVDNIFCESQDNNVDNEEIVETELDMDTRHDNDIDEQKQNVDEISVSEEIYIEKQHITLHGDEIITKEPHVESDGILIANENSEITTENISNQSSKTIDSTDYIEEHSEIVNSVNIDGSVPMDPWIQLTEDIIAQTKTSIFNTFHIDHKTSENYSTNEQINEKNFNIESLSSLCRRKLDEKQAVKDNSKPSSPLPADNCSEIYDQVCYEEVIDENMQSDDENENILIENSEENYQDAEADTEVIDDISDENIVLIIESNDDESDETGFLDDSSTIIIAFDDELLESNNIENDETGQVSFQINSENESNSNEINTDSIIEKEIQLEIENILTKATDENETELEENEPQIQNEVSQNEELSESISNSPRVDEDFENENPNLWLYTEEEVISKFDEEIKNDEPTDSPISNEESESSEIIPSPKLNETDKKDYSIEKLDESFKSNKKIESSEISSSSNYTEEEESCKKSDEEIEVEKSDEKEKPEEIIANENDIKNEEEVQPAEEIRSNKKRRKSDEEENKSSEIKFDKENIVISKEVKKYDEEIDHNKKRRKSDDEKRKHSGIDTVSNDKYTEVIKSTEQIDSNIKRRKSNDGEQKSIQKTADKESKIKCTEEIKSAENKKRRKSDDGKMKSSELEINKESNVKCTLTMKSTEDIGSESKKRRKSNEEESSGKMFVEKSGNIQRTSSDQGSSSNETDKSFKTKENIGDLKNKYNKNYKKNKFKYENFRGSCSEYERKRSKHEGKTSKYLPHSYKSNYHSKDSSKVIEKNNNSENFNANEMRDDAKTASSNVCNILNNYDKYFEQQRMVANYKIPKLSSSTSSKQEYPKNSLVVSNNNKTKSSDNQNSHGIKIKIKNITDQVYKSGYRNKGAGSSINQYKIINKHSINQSLISSNKLINDNNKVVPKVIIKRETSTNCKQNITNQTDKHHMFTTNLILNNAFKWQPFVRIVRDTKIDRMALKLYKQQKIILKINRVNNNNYHYCSSESSQTSSPSASASYKSASFKCRIKLDKNMLPAIVQSTEFNKD